MQPKLLWPLTGGKDLGFEVQPLARQGAQRIGRLQVYEVLRSLRRAQLRLGSRPPAVRLRPQILDLVHCRLGTQERGNAGRQRTGRQPVDQAVPFIAPGASSMGLRQSTNQSRRDKSRLNKARRKRRTQHEASIRLAW